jgi:hypothetical protein
MIPTHVIGHIIGARHDCRVVAEQARELRRSDEPRWHEIEMLSRLVPERVARLYLRSGNGPELVTFARDQPDFAGDSTGP